MLKYKSISQKPNDFIQYKPISEFPLSSRDLSFSIKDFSKSLILDETVVNFKHELLKEVFLFDYYKNEKKNEIKMAYRFLFQSSKKTITEAEVKKIINDIISKTLKIESVTIPGLDSVN